MNITRIIGILLIVAGVAGLALGGKFSYTKETKEAKIGPLELSVKDKESVVVPTWASIGAIAVGAALLLVRKKS